MGQAQGDADVAAAIRELAKQVDTLGNAVITAADKIARAISEGINVNVGKQPVAVVSPALADAQPSVR